MGVEDIYLSVFITMMIEKLRSAENLMSRSAIISFKLTQLIEILSEIQPLIADAAQKQIRDKAVKVWLTKLHQLVYDIDDLIDDLPTNTVTADNMLNKILPKSIIYRRMISSRLEEITHKLQDLSREKDSMGLVSLQSSYGTHRPRMEQTSIVADVVGREVEKYFLMRVLLGDDMPAASQNFSVVSIVGRGGIGKTTLAQALYNDNKVKDHFELQAWVCLSDEFDVFKITKIIYQLLGGFEKTFVNLDLLQVALMEQLSNKRFLLVLDDVWNEDYRMWELLQRPFLVGAPGSKILVTTQKESVASIMGSVHNYDLAILSHHDAIWLFAQYALNEHNFESRPDLKLIAEGFVQKCGGLPLALNLLGRILRTTTDVKDWVEVVNSDIWKLEDQGYIIPALRLSYDHLPGILKQLFAYCSFFPSDHVFQKDELVLLWMAEEFLYQSDHIKSMEEYGRDCFEELLSSSFFVHSTNDNQYIMHDFMHDLAIFAGGELFSTLDYKMDDNYESAALDKVRHLSFVRQRFGSYREFKALLRARRLRTLLAVSASLDGQQKFFLSNKVHATKFIFKV